ncbi:MAG: hypothetical protein K2V38_27015, partial [Gemmataceae bacterium]|nr:hypothetical protein [Gemmataceae bacterium]
GGAIEIVSSIVGLNDTIAGYNDTVAGRDVFATGTAATATANLFSTVMHFLFDLGKLRLRPDLNRDIKAAVENNGVIEELF